VVAHLDIQTRIRDSETALRTEALEQMQRSVDSSLRSAVREIRGVQYQMLKLEAQGWERRDVFINALLTYSEMIKFGERIPLLALRAQTS
jgi:hypothetical protein